MVTPGAMEVMAGAITTGKIPTAVPVSMAGPMSTADPFLTDGPLSMAVHPTPMAAGTEAGPEDPTVRDPIKATASDLNFVSG